MNAPKREETIFAEALRLPPPERAAYLAQATGGDADLRRRVEALLGSYAAGGFLEQAPASQLRQTLTVPLTEKPGDTIGRYKLLQQIGEGGCGVVYMAEQAEPVRRRVALKIIKLGMDTKSVIARFEAERQALAMMDHPNIAKVFDAGATETGRPYFVMELVRGVKITDYCDEKKLSTRARLDLFIHVCQAVQHAHQKGIIHRDIKPSNILVTVNDDVAVPKVIDFGVAKATGGQQLTDKTIFTAFEQFIGTPAYMSPEQAVLTSLDIDSRSDIYALGVLLYELLTGQTPFDPKELLTIGLDEMRRTIREQEPERPSTRVSTLPGQALSTTAQRRGLEAPKLVSELRGDLDWIVMKALEKDRARRYETANGLAADIQRHLNCEPVVACPPSKWYEFQKTVRRHKFGFAATAAIIVILFAGVLMSTWQAVRADAERERADRQATTANHVTAFMRQMLASANPDSSKSPDYTVREMLDDFAVAIDAQFADDPEVAAELHTTIGTAYWNMQQDEKAKTQLARALELRATVFGTNSEQYADALVEYAQIPSLKERAAYLHRALAIYKERGIEGYRVIHALWALQMIFDSEGKLDQIEALVTEAKAQASQTPGSNYWELAAMNNGLISAKTDEGKYAEAEKTAYETIANNNRQFGTDYIQTAWAYSALTRALMAQSKYAEALNTATQAVAIMRERISPDQVWYGLRLQAVLNTLTDACSDRALTNLFSSAGQLDELESLFQERLESKPLSPDNQNDPVNVAMQAVSQFPALYLELAAELSMAGQTNETAECRRNAAAMLKELETHYSDNPDLLSQLYLASVRSLVRLGDLDEANKLRQKLFALQHLSASSLNKVARTLATSPNPELRDSSNAVVYAEKAVAATSHTNETFLDTLAAAYAEAGNFDQALPLYEELLKVRKANLGPEHHDTLVSMNDLALTYEAAGKLNQALPLFEESLKGLEVTLGPDQRETLTVMDNLAWAYGLAGKLDQALPLCEKTLRLRKTALGPDHPDTLISMNDLALIYGKAGKPDQALTLFEETLKRMEIVLGPDHQETRNTMRNLANALAGKVKALLQAGKFAEAEPGAQECLRLREKLIPDSWLTFNAKSQLGGSLLGQQEYAEAEPLLLAGYKGMMARTDQIPPQGWPRVTETLQRLVRLYEDTNRPERATEWKQKLADLESADSLREQANSLARQQKWKEAAAVLRQAVELNPDDHFPCYQLAILYVQSGQSDQYRELCRRSVERFGHATDPRILERIAKNCLILPDSGADLVVVAQMAHRAAAADPSPWRQFVKGLADYRQENFTGAVESMRKLTAPRQGFEGMGNAMAYMVLAMAHYQLNQMDEAGAAFTKGVEISRTLPSLESGGPWVGYGWINWIEGHTLMSEAEALIEGSGRTMAETK